jgi:hypothetical protein
VEEKGVRVAVDEAAAVVAGSGRSRTLCKHTCCSDLLCEPGRTTESTRADSRPQHLSGGMTYLLYRRHTPCSHIVRSAAA